MADSTGPILAVGGVSFLNHWVGNNQGIDLRILVATGIAAGGLALLERASHQVAVGIAWISLISLLLISPTNGRSPVANLMRLTGLGEPK